MLACISIVGDRTENYVSRRVSLSLMNVETCFIGKIRYHKETIFIDKNFGIDLSTTQKPTLWRLALES